MMTKKKAEIARAESAAEKTTPQFNVFRPTVCSDGISEWTHYTPDTTIPWTADETAAWEKVCDENSPRARILGMQAQLAALEPITHPFIQLHVDAIREIHARLKRLTEIPRQMTVDEWMHWSEHDRATKQLQVMGESSEEDERLLLEADETWRKIVILRDVMPVRAEQDKNLADGRVKAVEIRQTASQKKIAQIRKVVEDLRRNNVTKTMTAEEMRDYMLKRNLSPYSPSSTLKHIKSIVAGINKKPLTGLSVLD